MDIGEIKRTLESWDGVLSQKQKKYIHYRSMRNFAFHYDELPGERNKEKVAALLAAYIDEVEYDLARSYLSKISDYYYDFLRFKPLLKMKFVIFFGGISDVILYFIGFLSKIWYIPIITLVLLAYYLFIVIFKEPEKRVYGLFY
jgi:hypothetical protein